MAVHNLQAESLTVTRWAALDTFPRNGNIVEVLGEDDDVYLAQWNVSGNRIVVEGGCTKIKAWRAIE